ncbi:MAG: threonylcarbamoyl-AMP synthase, partial [Verrucomicrobia bacterium]
MPASPPRIYRPTPLNLARLAAILRRGGIVGVPSETVYGLAANALDAEACAQIFTAKGRPNTDPLIVHLASVKDLAKVAQPNAVALRLAKAFWPGALTLVLPKQAIVPELITAGKATVAVRVPAHPLFRQLIRLSGCPLAAPSAN